MNIESWTVWGIGSSEKRGIVMYNATYCPYLPESVFVLQRNNIIGKRDELHVETRNANLSKNAFLFKDPFDQCRFSWYQKYRIRVVLSLSHKTLHLLCLIHVTQVETRRSRCKTDQQWSWLALLSVGLSTQYWSCSRTAVLVQAKTSCLHHDATRRLINPGLRFNTEG